MHLAAHARHAFAEESGLGSDGVGIKALLNALILKTAATQVNETMSLARFRDRRVEIIPVEPNDDPARSFIESGFGKRPPLDCSCSKPIAVFAAKGFHDRIPSEIPKRFTDFTKTTPEKTSEKFATIRQHGFAECDQEIDIGISSVAAPVTVGNIGATFSVGAFGPFRRFGTEYRLEIGNMLIDLARRVWGAIQLCNVAEV